MLRLTAIVSLLCLALSGVQAVMRCGRDRRNVCVPHHLCDIGFEEDGPMMDLQVTLRVNDGCMSTEKCCPTHKRLPENVVGPWMKPPEQTDCGLVNKKGITFTMRSADGFAQENELPWMIALLLREDGTYLGGGSLIALDVVLTAHHITKNYESDEMVVRAGEWDTNTDSEAFPHVDEEVRKIVRFPSFNSRSGANNIALLFVKSPFKLSRHIRPICLPSRNQNFDRKRCVFSGWGQDAVRQRSFMNIMKKVDLPVVSRRTCENQMKNHYGPTFRLHDSMMCAGGEEGKDSCMGDGGSPLACPLENDPDRFEQAGIVNWGVGCGKENTPAVYTDVAKFRGWIDQQIQAFSRANDESAQDDEYDDRYGRSERGDRYDRDNKDYQTIPRVPRPTTIGPPKAATYSSHEIDPDKYLTVSTPIKTDEPPAMIIIHS